MTETNKPTRSEMLEMLDRYIQAIEALPQHALYAPVTHSDFVSMLLLLSAILKEDDCP